MRPVRKVANGRLGFLHSGHAEGGGIALIAVLGCAFLLSSSCMGQEPDPTTKIPMIQALRVYVDECRNPPPARGRTYDEKTLVDHYGAALVPELIPLLKDQQLRSSAHAILVLLGTKGACGDDRRLAVLTLVKHTIVESRYFPPGPWYQDFSRDDFSEEAKGLLRNALDLVTPKTQSVEAPLLLLVGSSGDTSILSTLQSLDRNRPEPRPGLDPLIARPALRACARLGDQDAIKECIGVVDTLANADSKARILGALSYVRQEQVVEYIRGYLLSDQQSQSLGRDAQGGAYYVAAQLALVRMLDGFPRQASLEDQRNWMKEQKAWKIRR